MVGSFESLAAVARRIIEFEAIPGRALHFEMHVSADHGTDEDVLGHLEYRGRHAAYVIEQQTH
ncbi:MAG: hypothetical protein M5U16_01470 [Hyphomicrobium sp.]|nr:hypothetical protein [Hyphomicrobium sp.]